MQSTNVYIIAFCVGSALAMSVIFAAASNTVVGWVVTISFWLLVFIGLVLLLSRLMPGEEREGGGEEFSPPHPLIADVVDPKGLRGRKPRK